MAQDRDRVTVRMYRGVLGDCFLVTSPRKSGGWHHMLIDCGVLQNVEAGPVMVEKLPKEVVDAVGREALAKVEPTKPQLRRIGEDVKSYVKANGGRIDLMVISHEHYDHVGGFTLPDVENRFLDADLEIAELWLGWTEDFSDDQANALRARFAKGKKAVVAAAEAGRHAAALAAAGGSDADRKLADGLAQVRALADFIGPVAGPGLPAVPPGTKTTADAIQAMREKTGAANTRYLEPGQVVDVGDTGLRAYVLAPPRDEKKLARDLPGAKEHHNVLYLTNIDEAAAVESAARATLEGLRLRFAADAEDAPLAQDGSVMDPPPFARPHLRDYPKKLDKPSKDAPPEQHALHRNRVAARELYESDKRRGISADWTEAAGALALKMDSDTNNTSLVLALELPGGGMLLFPGDAQVGNWESWGDQVYPSEKHRPKNSTAPGIPIEDILRRVIFYKVGHHGSHNATHKSRGLELMTDDRLVAAIPLVEAVAKVQGPGKKRAGKGWKMPYHELHDELVKRSRNRIVQGDGDPAAERAAFAASPVDVTLTYQDEANGGGLWVELGFALGGTGAA